MPSRRQLLAAFGATLPLAGCATTETTTGTITRKSVTVGVPQRVGDPVDVSVALLAYEPDRGLLHGEYDPEYVAAVVDDGSLSVRQSTHDRLVDRFTSVRYTVNVVPAEGRPANGVVTREACNGLSLGGTATVAPYVEKQVGHLDVREAAPPADAPDEVTIGQFDLDERADRK
jgi:hypothetical protein